MRGTRYIGTISGIPIRFHWSFFLVIVWSAHVGYRAGGWGSVLFSVTVTMILFGCVFLHELGHAIAARRYGVLTRSITLLPIGGVAALERIPERPGEELVIALAGPMVNVVIAAALIAWIGWPEGLLETGPIWDFPHLLEMVLLMNIIMIVFNMIPAFPMDGGRVLRACLALFLSYPRATSIASAIGQTLAVLMMIAGFHSNPFLCLIGIMVFLGAKAESRHVHLRSVLSGILVRDVMVPVNGVIAPGDPLRVCLEAWHDKGQSDFLVQEDRRIVGLLDGVSWRKNLLDPDRNSLVGQVMERPVVLLRSDMPLISLCDLMRSSTQSIYPVMEFDQPVGMIPRIRVLEIMAQERRSIHLPPRAVNKNDSAKVNPIQNLRLDVG